MKHIMIDLETLGTNDNAPVLSIGATFFEPSTGEQGADFYETIDLVTCVEAGAKPDMETFIWWLQQSDQARTALTTASLSLSEVLRRFAHFCKRYESDYDDDEEKYQIQVWGNGATFDLTILKNAYRSIGRQIPWHFTRERDVRTVVELGQAVGIDPKATTYMDDIPHHALHDARYQAMYLSIIWQKLVGAS